MDGAPPDDDIELPLDPETVRELAESKAETGNGTGAGSDGEAKAVVLLSGGLDSATCLAIADEAGYKLEALAVDYSQRHDRELEAARKVADHFEAPLTEVKLDLEAIGGSALTDDAIDVPRNDLPGLEDEEAIPPTYVPARNTILLGLALALAEVRGARAVYIGANALDYSGYPDCRPAFIAAFQTLAGVGTRAGVQGNPPRIEAPLIYLSKGQIIKTGLALNVPYELTWSCYEGGERPCGECDSCLLRAKGFQEAEAEDPLLA